ncbi:PilZ domain-containing protein [Sphingomonas sp.]|uniref:PilZ domain-containing protein n=1 Tax=Sphingomonas sp. TaxID=28214 RepID=UPI002DD63F54|nr:PilZ domain-containing protein [Sphingomonas sp.]
MASRATAYRPIVSAEQVNAQRFGATAAAASVRGLADDGVDAAITEISIYGCRLACTAEATADQPVSIRLGGSLPIAARVIWVKDGMIGCRFDQPIGRPLLRSLTIGK